MKERIKMLKNKNLLIKVTAGVATVILRAMSFFDREKDTRTDKEKWESMKKTFRAETFDFGQKKKDH